MNTCFFVFAARQETSTGLIVQQGSVTSFILSAGPYRHTTNTRWAALSAGQLLQKKPLTKHEVKKSSGQGAGPRTPLTYIIDLVNNGHLILLHDNPGVCTRGSLSPSSKSILHHNLCLSLGHNERLVIGERPRPLAEPSAEGLAASMGSLYPAERDGQCQTRLAQRGNSVGTWEKHGRAAAHLVTQHNGFCTSMSADTEKQNRERSNYDKTKNLQCSQWHKRPFLKASRPKLSSLLGWTETLFS